nr:MAG TPA: hypothetical protein [Caudoviricetes sp.]
MACLHSSRSWGNNTQSCFLRPQLFKEVHDGPWSGRRDSNPQKRQHQRTNRKDEGGHVCDLYAVEKMSFAPDGASAYKTERGRRGRCLSVFRFDFVYPAECGH